MDFERFLIKSYQYWDLYLAQEANTLGRVYLWCRRQSAVSLTDMTYEETIELHALIGEIAWALGELFVPDHMNYLALGNITAHLHVHIVPRYSSPREFGGMTFEDREWGKPLRQGYSVYHLNDLVVEQLKGVIAEKLEERH